jgi:hypothetical protein
MGGYGSGSPYMRTAIGAATLITIVCIVFGPLLFAVVWHLRHGQKVLRDGIQVSVPARWWARVDDETISLYKHSSTVFGPDTALSSLSRNRGRVATSQSEEATVSILENLYLKMRDGNDFNPVGSVTMGSGATRVTCFKAHSVQYPSWFTADCILLSGAWHAHFTGKEQELDTFFQIVRGITTQDAIPQKAQTRSSE